MRATPSMGASDHAQVEDFDRRTLILTLAVAI